MTYYCITKLKKFQKTMMFAWRRHYKFTLMLEMSATHSNKAIGRHLLRYPWSAISDWAWNRNLQYQTEESGVRHYIGYRNKLLSYIQHSVVYGSVQWLRGNALDGEKKSLGLESSGGEKTLFDIGYRNGLRCQYQNSSDIGMTVCIPTYFLPISE